LNVILRGFCVILSDDISVCSWPRKYLEDNCLFSCSVYTSLGTKLNTSLGKSINFLLRLRPLKDMRKQGKKKEQCKLTKYTSLCEGFIQIYLTTQLIRCSIYQIKYLESKTLTQTHYYLHLHSLGLYLTLKKYMFEFYVLHCTT